jgi:hypothetical protein
MSANRISKSQFLMGLQCLKRLWLYNYRKDLIPSVGPEQQQIFDQGHAIGALARLYFAGGTLVEEDYRHLPEAVKNTARLIAGGAEVIYEAAFISGKVLARCDILKRGRDGCWDLIEVKGSTEVKDEYLYDVAVQRRVLEGAGLKIGRAELMHLDNTFVKHGPIEPQKIFKRQDITVETAALMPEIAQDLEKFMEVLASAAPPETGIGQHCSKPYDCEFRGHCWKGIPEHSIYDIPRLSWEKKNTLKAMGILRFADVPDGFDLNDGQKLALQVEKTGKTYVDKKKLARFIKKLKYPLHHIDFETVMPALPLYDGSRPYQQVPFQVSLHVQAGPGAEPAHFEYLGDGKTDPRPGLINFLLAAIGPEGTLLAYNASFEAKRIEELARDFPEHAPALSALAGRFEDLMKPFQESAYAHPQCHGRFSLKKVLPALVPGMTYEGLAVANGGDAQLAYCRLLSGELPPEDMERLRKDLKVYCGQDTLAMVKILEQLALLTAPRDTGK